MMTIVVDTNLAIGAVMSQQYSTKIVARLSGWRQSGEHLIAPTLLEYEITTALQRVITQGLLDKRGAEMVLDAILKLGIELISPSREHHLDALRWAERLGHSKAYDAQYVALAAREGAPLWTADRRLANAAQAAGLAWVHWIGQEEA